MATSTKTRTLADLVTQQTGDKRKREVTHIEGIPVACILEGKKADGARQICGSRRAAVAGHVAVRSPSGSKAATVINDGEEEEDDDDDLIVVVMEKR